MLKKLAMTVNLIGCLTLVSWAHAADTCFNLSLNTDNNVAPSLLRPTFSAEECSTVQNTLKSSGRFPNIFTPQGTNLLPLCFVSNANDPYAVTNGVHAKIGSRAVTINSLSAWTNDFTPNLPDYPFYIYGSDNAVGVITQWIVRADDNGKILGKVFTTDTIVTNQLLTSGYAGEQDVVIGGTDKFSGVKGSIRIDAQVNQQGLPEIKGLTGKLCIPL